MATGALDAQGVYQYGEDDNLSPFSTFMNLLAASVSTQLAGKAGGTLTNGYAEIVANSAGVASATLTNVAGMAVTVTLLAGRRYKVSVDTGVSSNIANDRVALAITDNGATWMQAAQVGSPTTNTNNHSSFSRIYNNPTPGAHTFQVQVARATGATGTVSLAAGPTAPSFIMVEDLGPVR